MEPHLAHRLPWQSLAELVRATRTYKNRADEAVVPTEEQLKALFHFSRCLLTAVTEFAASDRSSDEEREELDPRKWNVNPDFDRAEGMGYYSSILRAYVELNLLLTDTKTFEALLFRRRTRYTAAIREVTCERVDRHLREQVFRGGGVRDLAAPGALQALRDHAALLFHCLYTLLPPHGKLDAHLIAERVRESFCLESFRQYM